MSQLTSKKNGESVIPIEQVQPSKTQINKLGDRIRNENGKITTETIQELENYRTSHKDALAGIFKKLCFTAYRIESEAIVTYRIKRFESIIRKLTRFPDMKFSRMGDIGGCRCIVKNNEQAYRLVAEIEKILSIKKINDYILNPQEDGYKSIHIYATLPDDEKQIEIQIRNQVDHNWATLVEISDLLFDSELKEYGKNPDLYNFHKLLSCKDKLTTNNRKELARVIKKYKYIENLSKVFTRNHIRVREQWLSINPSSRLKYFLITTSKTEVPKIEAFDDFDKAEKAYFSKFQNNQKLNIVLTHLPKPNYNQISTAYSNYILTMHSFEDESSHIFENLIIDSLKSRHYRDFFKYFDYYQAIVYNRIVNSVKELVHSKTLPANKNSFVKKTLSKKEREWQRDILKEINLYQQKVGDFQRLFKKHYPKKGLKRVVFQFMLTRILKKYDKKMETISDRLDD